MRLLHHNMVFFSLILILFIPQSSIAGNDFILTFGRLLKETGWEFRTRKHNYISITYFSPNGFDGKGFMDSYGPSNIEFSFEEKDNIESIPWANDDTEQTYCHEKNSPEMFGVLPGSKAAYAHGLTHLYCSYRYGSKLFNFSGSMRNKLIRKYCIADATGCLESFKQYLSAIYKKDKKFYEAVIVLQKYLADEGLYKRLPDGEFGSGTAESFQLFLKKHGYYSDPIDRDYGKGTRNAIKKLQKYIGVRETGILNLETANNILKIFT